MRNSLRQCMSSVEGPNRRGRPLGRWEDRVKEYLTEWGVRGNGLEWAKREWLYSGVLFYYFSTVLFLSFFLSFSMYLLTL